MGKQNRFWSWLFVILGTILAIRTINNIIRLSKANERLKSADVEISMLEAKKADLESRLTTVQTDDYVERTAREKLGLGRAGEIVVVMEEGDGDRQGAEPKDQTANWKLWRRLYLGF